MPGMTWHHSSSELQVYQACKVLRLMADRKVAEINVREEQDA